MFGVLRIEICLHKNPMKFETKVFGGWMGCDISVDAYAAPHTHYEFLKKMFQRN